MVFERIKFVLFNFCYLLINQSQELTRLIVLERLKHKPRRCQEHNMWAGCYVVCNEYLLILIYSLKTPLPSHLFQYFPEQSNQEFCFRYFHHRSISKNIVTNTIWCLIRRSFFLHMLQNICNTFTSSITFKNRNSTTKIISFLYFFCQSIFL